MARRWSRKRKTLVTTVAVAGALGLLYLWLPYRVAVTQLYIRLGGSRLTIPAEYKPLDSPACVPVADAGGYPSDAEVVALDAGGEARAIPLKRLAWHLVMNDRIAGDDVAVTLCGVSDAALAYRAKCRGQVLHFAPARLSRNNLVLRDRETGSSWQQFTGKAIDGALAGAELERIPLWRGSLSQWRRNHPAGVVLAPSLTDHDTVAPNDKCPVMSYFATRPFLLQSPTYEDARLGRKARVVGEMAGGVARARRESTGGRATAGMEVACYWFAWVEFHPQTQLLAGGSGEGH